MALYLGALGRRVVSYSLASPTAEKIANNVGIFLHLATNSNYKMGLTRTAFILSQSLREGDSLAIRSGEIYRNGKPLRPRLPNEDLFGGISVEDVKVDDKMLTPEGMASFIRWNVFLDRRKVRDFILLLGEASILNITLNSVLATHFHRLAGEQHLPWLIMGWENLKFGIAPAFHAITDPAGTFVGGKMTGLTTGHPFASVLFTMAFIGMLGSFHRDEMILSHSAHTKWSRISNGFLALTLSGVLTHALFFSRFRGAWDYLLLEFNAFGYINISVYNTSDILMLLGLAGWILLQLLTPYPFRHQYVFHH